jgi:hypothetical protein
LQQEEIMAEPGSKAEALEMYAEYIKAEAAVLTGKSYQIGNRMLTREDLREIRRGRQEWGLKSGAVKSQRVFRIIPRD